MPLTHYYRYTSNVKEAIRLRDERKVGTTNPKAQGTWYTEARYENPIQAQEQLALKKPPEHRIGPIRSEMIPDNMVIRQRSVAPANGHPGGGTEIMVPGDILLFGCWEFNGGQYIF